jgi:hypothetical protein
MTRNSDESTPDVAELTPLVYRELRQIAAAYLRRERPGQTLQATALVHEAYLRLAGAGSPWRDERHSSASRLADAADPQIALKAAPRNAGPNWIASRSGLARSRNGSESMLPAVDGR